MWGDTESKPLELKKWKKDINHTALNWKVEARGKSEEYEVLILYFDRQLSIQRNEWRTENQKFFN